MQDPLGLKMLPRRVRRRVLRHLAWHAAFALLITLIACSKIVGIEDVHEGPAPGTGGADNAGGIGGSTPGNGGSTPGGGRSNNGEANGGTSNNGGNAGTAQGGRAGQQPAGGNGDTAPAGAAGELGEAGMGGAPSPGTVLGHVIDYWGHKVANAPVQIGATLTNTDDQGAFSIADVPATYDVTLVADFTSPGRHEIYGWAFLGLTRRDPTLQVYSALAKRSSYFTILPSNSQPADSTHTLHVAFGGPDGGSEFSNIDVNGVMSSTEWRGPSTTSETAHGLLWQRDATTRLPTAYLGYDKAQVTLSDISGSPMINLNLATTTTIASGALSGTVTPAADVDRGNQVFLRFASGGSIQLVDQSPASNTFSYLVPTIANSALTFAAYEGDSYYGSYAVAHSDDLAAGNSAATVAIPTPAKPLLPSDGALNIGENSSFSISPGKGNAGGYLVSMIATQYYDGLYVVTANKQFSLPAFAGGAHQLVSTHAYAWRVETHGSFATVDSMAGPTGFLDSFSSNETPRGPRTGSGSYSISVSRVFTAK